MHHPDPDPDPERAGRRRAVGPVPAPRGRGRRGDEDQHLRLPAAQERYERGGPGAAAGARLDPDPRVPGHERSR